MKRDDEAGGAVLACSAWVAVCTTGLLAAAVRLTADEAGALARAGWAALGVVSWFGLVGGGYPLVKAVRRRNGG